MGDSSRRLAVLDLGSLTVRLGLAETTPTGPGWRWLRREERVTALGAAGGLAPEACRRTLQVLLEYQELCREYGAKETLAVATQVLRQAQDGQSFLTQAASETGFRIRVLTPREEAVLAWQGMVAVLPPALAALRPRTGFDLGGGSLEWLWQTREEPPAYLSLPLSPLALAAAWQAADPPQAEDLEHLRRQIRELSAPLRRRAAGLPPPAMLLGSGGAATTLAALYRQEGGSERQPGLTFLTLKDLEAILARLASMTAALRARQPLLGPAKGALIIPAALIIREIMSLWPALPLTVTDAGLLEGLLSLLLAGCRGDSGAGGFIPR